MRGIYGDIEYAKKGLKTINTGSRFIAEVSSQGILNRDPHIISGISQTSANGFNKWWEHDKDIEKLIDMCKRYIDSRGK